jgi:hypothetical protein
LKSELSYDLQALKLRMEAKELPAVEIPKRALLCSLAVAMEAIAGAQHRHLAGAAERGERIGGDAGGTPKSRSANASPEIELMLRTFITAGGRWANVPKKLSVHTRGPKRTAAVRWVDQ